MGKPIIGICKRLAPISFVVKSHGINVGYKKRIAVLISLAGSCLGFACGAFGEDYAYKQTFMPRQTLEIDPATTAMFVTDPQNDFMSERSPIWALVGPIVERNNLVERQKALRNIASEKGIRVFYSPHMYTEQDFANWKSLNGIDRIMFQNKMFLRGSHGHAFHPELMPDQNTVVMNPHKGLSNFQTGDALIQLRQYGIKTLIMYGMASNMCVESHARDAIEAGFDLIIIADVTAAAGDQAYNAALTNYEFLAHEVMTFDQVMARLKKVPSQNGQ